MNTTTTHLVFDTHEIPDLFKKQQAKYAKVIELYNQMGLDRDEVKYYTKTEDEIKAHENPEEYKVDLTNHIHNEVVSNLFNSDENAFDVFKLSPEDIAIADVVQEKTSNHHGLKLKTFEELSNDKDVSIPPKSNIVEDEQTKRIKNKSISTIRTANRLNNKIGYTKFNNTKKELRQNYNLLSKEKVDNAIKQEKIPENQVGTFYIGMTLNGLKKNNAEELERAIKLFKSSGDMSELFKVYNKYAPKKTYADYQKRNIITVNNPNSTRLYKSTYDEYAKKDPILVKIKALHHQFALTDEESIGNKEFIESHFGVAYNWIKDTGKVEDIENPYIPQTPNTSVFQKWGFGVFDNFKHTFTTPVYDLTNELDDKELIIRQLNILGKSYNTRLEIEYYDMNMDFIRIHRPYCWQMIMTNFIETIPTYEQNDLTGVSYKYDENGKIVKSVQINPEMYKDDFLRELEYHIKQTNKVNLPDEFAPLDVTKVLLPEEDDKLKIIDDEITALTPLEHRLTLAYWHGLKNGDYDIEYLKDVASGKVDINDCIVQLPSDENIKYPTMQKSALKVLEIQAKYEEIQPIVNQQYELNKNVQTLYQVVGIYAELCKLQDKFKSFAVRDLLSSSMGAISFVNRKINEEISLSDTELRFDVIKKSIFGSVVALPTMNEFIGKSVSLNLSDKHYYNVNGCNDKFSHVYKPMNDIDIGDWKEYHFKKSFYDFAVIGYINNETAIKQFLHDSNIKSLEELIEYYKMVMSVAHSALINGVEPDEFSEMIANKVEKVIDVTPDETNDDVFAILDDEDLNEINEMQEALAEQEALANDIDVTGVCELILDDEILQMILNIKNDKLRNSILETIKKLNAIETLGEIDVTEIIEKVNQEFAELLKESAKKVIEKSLLEEHEEQTEDEDIVTEPQEPQSSSNVTEEPTIIDEILTLEQIKELTKGNPLIDGYRFAHIAPSVITKDVLADIKAHKIKFHKSLQHWSNKVSETGVILPTQYLYNDIISNGFFDELLHPDTDLTYGELLNLNEKTVDSVYKLTNSKWNSNERYKSTFAQDFVNTVKLNEFGAIINTEEPEMLDLLQKVINDYNAHFNSGDELLNATTNLVLNANDFPLSWKEEPLSGVEMLDFDDYYFDFEGRQINTNNIPESVLNALKDEHIYIDLEDDATEDVKYLELSVDELKGFHPLTFDAFWEQSQVKKLLTNKMIAITVTNAKEKMGIEFAINYKEQMEQNLNQVLRNYMKVEHIQAIQKEMFAKQQFLRLYSSDELANSVQNKVISPRLKNLLHWLYESYKICVFNVLAEFNPYETVKKLGLETETNAIAKDIVIQPSEKLINEIEKGKETYAKILEERERKRQNGTSDEWFWKMPKYARDEFVRMGLLDKRNWVDSTISYAEEFKKQRERMAETHKNGLKTDYDIQITYANELAEFREESKPKKDPLFTTEVCKELQEHWKRQQTEGTMEYDNIQYLKKYHGYCGNSETKELI